MSIFTWKDRDSAAQHLLQLVYHGPASIRHSALETLQAIRSLSIVQELKQITLDSMWSNKDRADAVYALAAMPTEIYFPELASIPARYVGSGFVPLNQALESANDEALYEHLLGERDLLYAIFRLLGMHPSNLSWFSALLDQAPAAVKAEFLTWVISSNCLYPGEPFFLDILTKHLDQYPELITLQTLNTVANHGDIPENHWLVEHVDKIISLCIGADEGRVSAVLSYSPDLTAKIAETHPEIAKLSSLFPDLETYLESTTSDSSESKASTSYVPAFYSSAIWQRLEQIYQRANAGDELAFDQLYELTDDYRLSIPVKAVATYFLGKLWTHDRALNKLCRLARDGDEAWGKKDSEDSPIIHVVEDRPIRVQAVEALHITGTPQAWETLVDVIFLDRGSSSIYYDKFLRWLSALTSQLDPSIPFKTVKEDQYNAHIASRPWFNALTEATDDLDTVLKDL